MGGLNPASANAGAAGGASGGSASGGSASGYAAGATAMAERGQAGLLGAPDQNNKFNLGSNPDNMAGATQRYGSGAAGTAPRVNEISNNSGGGIPGGSGQGSGGNARGFGGRGGAAGSSGYSTDIERGFRTGSYNPAVGSNSIGDGTPEQQRAIASARAETLDLAQYLPGGRRDPTKVILGLTREQAESLGIHGKYVNIFEKITDRIRAKCALHELWDCNGEETHTDLKAPLVAPPPSPVPVVAAPAVAAPVVAAPVVARRVAAVPVSVKAPSPQPQIVIPAKPNLTMIQRLRMSLDRSYRAVLKLFGRH